VRPSFSPPRRDLRPADADPGANEVYSHRLDQLNSKYERLLEMLSKRLRTAIEVNGADGLVSEIYSLFKLHFVINLPHLMLQFYPGLLSQCSVENKPKDSYITIPN
jgi:hypothetical protein